MNRFRILYLSAINYYNQNLKRPNYIQNTNNFENQHTNCKYVKENGVKNSSEKYYRAYASTASDSDSSTSHSSSELTGFKIVYKGKTIHDETDEDFEKNECTLGAGNGKFASSVMVIGPNAKDISLPTFA